MELKIITLKLFPVNNSLTNIAKKLNVFCKIRLSRYCSTAYINTSNKNILIAGISLTKRPLGPPSTRIYQNRLLTLKVTYDLKIFVRSVSCVRN